MTIISRLVLSGLPQRTIKSTLKMKQKMTAVDVRALVLLLRRKLVGLRVANIYDVSGRLYLLKMSRANRKEHLLIESGTRIHTTNYVKNQKDLPSGFSMKLRKHLRTKKLESITQLGVDRVIDLTFGKGEAAYHILVEFYAAGNVILTDHEYTILSLLRSHKFEEDAKIAVKQQYPFSHAANMTIENIVTDPEKIKVMINPPAVVEEVPVKEEKSKKGGKKNKPEPTPKKAKKDEKQSLKMVLTKMVPYASFPYADHVLRGMGQAPNSNATADSIEVLIEAALKLKKLIADMEDMDDITGFIVYKDEESKESAVPEEQEDKSNKELQVQSEEVQEMIKKFEGKVIKEFIPCFLLEQHKGEKFLEYESFDQCVDEYFSQAEKYKEKTKIENKENAIWSKMHRIQEDQNKRIEGLQREQDLSEFKAQLLQKYAFEAQAIIDILSVMVSSGISWQQITSMVKEERKSGNPLANLIYKLNLEKNTVSLMLDGVDEDIDSTSIQVDSKHLSNFDQVLKVDIDLAISAQLNIKKYFEIKKKSFQKEVKTKDAAEVAIKQAEDAAKRDFQKFKQQQIKTVQRKVFWFEKFVWFITSENYLVIGGRNAQQNEALVKRYMDKTDLFMHSELHGAAVCIIKNPSGLPVPNLTLNEAATFEMCHSPCWEHKVMTQVYWVNAAQVSKTPPTGMFIQTGSFIIRGKRNFIQPQKLELGFTLMFALGEESLANHMGERKLREDIEELQDKQSDDIREPELSKQRSNITDASVYDESDEIQVVQVGEQPREYKPKEEFNRQPSTKTKQQKSQQQSKPKGGKQEQPKGKKSGRNKADIALDEEDYSKTQNTGAVKRGKHQKIKKMKQKYGDQDEEERKMAMKMLGTKDVEGFDLEGHKKHKHGNLIKQTSTVKMEAEEQDVSESQEVDQTEEASDSRTTEEQTQVENAAEEQVKESQEDVDKDDEAEIAKLIKEEDINVVPENTDVSEIDKLTGQPKAKDVLLFAIPMLAPYTTINSFKYKVKIQPGTLKRGRAQKTIRSLFLSQSGKSTQHEPNLIKAVSDTDMTMTLINSCRVMAPGLQKVQQQSKADKKRKAKE